MSYVYEFMRLFIFYFFKMFWYQCNNYISLKYIDMNANQVFLKKFSKNLNINNKSSSFC